MRPSTEAERVQSSSGLDEDIGKRLRAKREAAISDADQTEPLQIEANPPQRMRRAGFAFAMQPLLSGGFQLDNQCVDIAVLAVQHRADLIAL